MIKNLIIIAFLSLSVVFVSCEGDVGPAGETGPAGPAGPGGPAGTQGPKGDTGVAGQNGIGARVIQSGNVNSYQGGYVLGRSGLTTADSLFLAKSVIQVYVASQGRWWALPGRAYWDDNTYTNFAVYNRYLNSRLYIVLRPIDWSEDQETAPERFFTDIRAVIIPMTDFRSNGEVDYSNYEETVKSLGLTEADVIKSN